LEKGDGGGFSDQEYFQNEFSNVSLTLTLPWRPSVMGMIRLPTKASDGKANLHRGAIGVGINIKEGTTLTAVHHSMVITHHPDTSHPLSGFRVPYWEEMLLMAARTFDMTGLGYLGVDIVIDRERGPLLLELNALPGLQIQIANQTGLLRRLELIDKATADIFATAEARVAWALEKVKTVDAYPEKWECLGEHCILRPSCPCFFQMTHSHPDKSYPLFELKSVEAVEGSPLALRDRYCNAL
jgi:hypothetical protein